MNFYIAHILSSNLDLIHLYNATSKNESKKTINSLRQLDDIDDAKLLLVLIPSSEVTSYEFIQNSSLSEQINIANFISDVDSNFIDSVSDNEYFLSEAAGYVVNKSFLAELNQYLSNLNYKVHVTPEYLINSFNDSDSITQIDEKFMFAYKNKCGFSISSNNLNQYLELVVNDKPNYEPIIYSSNIDLNNKYLKGELKGEDIKVALHQIFTNVRLKTLIELRDIDCLPVEYAMAPVAFTSGLINEISIRERLLDVFNNWTLSEKISWNKLASSLDANKIGPNNKKFIDWIKFFSELSLEGLSIRGFGEEKYFLGFFDNIISNGTFTEQFQKKSVKSNKSIEKLILK